MSMDVDHRASDAIARFRRAAIEKGDFATPAERDWALTDEMARARADLRALGATGQAAYRQLLNDESAYVQQWVAADLLAEGDQEAFNVMQRLLAAPGVVALNARITLQEYEAGRFRGPFRETGRTSQ
jgi:hypothetical protein